ncbi:MAG TPA: penicillin acylase family protein, partial [Candidatus Dormibacteraeota bacterium]|nr:penicillin acylase family protein [Candidatus Dormibacteraeota bacterium]
GGGARAVAGATDGPGAAPDTGTDATGTDATGTDATGTPAARRALELLTGWDCAVGAGSGAALLYERLVTCLTRRVLGAALGEPLARQVTGQGDLNAALPGGPYLATPTDVVLRLLESGRPAIGAAPDPAAVAALLRDALSEAERETVARHGPDVARWRWGDENRLAFVHPLARAFPALAAVLSRGPLPAGGDLDTVNLSARGADGGVLAGNSGPVYRAVYDLADWSRSRAGHAPGQSGHPGSRGYADMIPGWLAVAPPPLPWGPAPEGRRLILVPAGRSG